MSLSLKCIFQNIVDQILGGAEDIIVGLAKADYSRFESGFNQLANGVADLPAGVIDAAMFPASYAIDELDEIAHDVDDQLNEWKDKAADEVDKGLKGIGHVVEETASTIGDAVGGMVSSFFGSTGLGTWLLIGLGVFLFMRSGTSSTTVIEPVDREDNTEIEPVDTTNINEVENERYSRLSYDNAFASEN